MAQSYSRVLLLADSSENGGLLEKAVKSLLRVESLLVIDAETLAKGHIPHADCALVDETFGARPGLEAVRTLRARGFDSGVVLVTHAANDAAIREQANRLGAVQCITRSDVHSHPTLHADALIRAMGEQQETTPELRRLRRVLAAGEIALGLQHSINNPLAALLAEAQLLQFEELTAEQRASVDRMVELCRRLATLVRRLDALAGPQSPP
jgi:signal transduction histidine kinase